PFDPVVQEGMLVLGYALQQLGAQVQAKQQYEFAIERLEQVRVRLDELWPELQDGRFFATVDAEVDHGWRRWLADFDAVTRDGYKRLLTADADFVDAAEARRPRVLQQGLLADHSQALTTLSQDDVRVQALQRCIDEHAQRSAAPLE